MPAVSAAIAALGLCNAMLDGELVALQPDGVSSFPMLQAALKAGRDSSLVFYAFDLLHLDGWDLRGCKLLDRKRVLEGAARWDNAVRYSGHVVGQAVEMYRSAGRMKLEGIICKRAQAPYRSGRSGDWLKVKCLGREELIVLGWTTPTRSRVGLGALQLGYHDPEGQLHYAGAVGTGFTDRELATLRERLDAMAAPAPVGLLVADGEPIDPATHWVRPELVVEVKYTGWSGAGRVRHGVYLGLRQDKVAGEVVRDMADSAAPRVVFQAKPANRIAASKRKSWHGAVPPRPRPRLVDMVVPSQAASPTTKGGYIEP